MKILRILKSLLVVAPQIIFAYFSWMLKYSINPDKYPFAERFSKVKKLLSTIIKNMNFDIKVVNADKLPNETCCIMSNHIAALDPFMFISISEKPLSLVCKKEIYSYPFAGRCLRCIDAAFLDRQDLKQSLRLMMKLQQDLTNKEQNWLIFPEGTRNNDLSSNLLDFHHGTFKAPMKANVPIVPACVWGSFRGYKFKGLKRYPAYVEYGEPLYPKDYENLTTEEVANIIQNRVQKMITYHARRYDQEFITKLKK